MWYMKVSCKMCSCILIMAPWFAFKIIVCLVSITIRGWYVGAISMSMCVRYQIGPVGVLMVLGVHFCIGGNFLTGVRCC